MASAQDTDQHIPRSPDHSSASQRSLPSPSLKHTQKQRPLVSTSSSSTTRRTSNASIASASSSISTVLDAPNTPDGSTFNDVSQNSISSLLSHPIVRTGLVPQSALSVPSAHRPPSARDIPPVTLTPIPHVESSAFKPYLAKAGALYDSYRKSKLATEEPSATPFTKGEKDAARGDYFASRVQSPKASSPSTPRQSSLSSPTSPTALRRTSTANGVPKRDKYAPTPLSTIPNVYFDDNFQLANPRTFDVVSERSDVIPPDPQTSRNDSKDSNEASKSQTKTRRKALHTNAILQEKLSWYMDTVEVHLIASIATASSSFFAALGSLKELQSEATESITKIKSLRDALRQLDDEMALGGLEVLTMRRRRENLRRLAEAVSQISEVIEEAKSCETLVDNGSLVEADSRIDALEALISGTTTEPNENTSSRIDLRQIKALEGISDGVTQLRQRIGKGYENQFIDALLADLRAHVDSVPPRETIQRWSNASLRTRGDQNRGNSTAPTYLRTNEQLRPELLKALEGLVRAGQTTRAATAYREAIMREIKGMVRRHLPASNDDDVESVTSISTTLSARGGGRRMNQQEKSSILARNLRALDPDSAEELLVKVYTSVGEALRRLGVQVKVVLDVTSNLDQPTLFPPRSSSLTPSSEVNQIRDEVTQALDMSNLLGQAVDVIQTQVSKVLKVRSEQNTRLPFQQFLRYFTLNKLFTDECEAVSSRGGESLKEVVNAQVKDFLQAYADTEKQRIIQTLEVDRWDVKDFGPNESRVLSRVLESMNRTPQAWTDNAKVSGEPLMSSHANGDTALRPAEEFTSAKTRPATIDDQSYFLVHSTISALHSIDSYLNLAAAIPSLTVECSLKLLDHIKAFNSRCCQLILGAGATKSAGLKNITSKHLALASQACSFLVALIPYMREFVRRQTGGNVGNSFAEFDKVKRLLQEHQNSIHEKLVDIMSKRSLSHANAMKKINWDAPEREPTVNTYMESLTKETGTLHRVLSRTLPETDVRMIMTPIFAHYHQEWSKAFREAPVRTEAGKARMLHDVQYLDSRLGKLEGSGELGPNLIQLVKDRPVQSRPATTETKQQPSETSESRKEEEKTKKEANALPVASQEQEANTREEPAKHPEGYRDVEQEASTETTNDEEAKADEQPEQEAVSVEATVGNSTDPTSIEEPTIVEDIVIESVDVPAVLEEQQEAETTAPAQVSRQENPDELDKVKEENG